MSTFHHNSPRPPVVPGEETEGVSTTSSLHPAELTKLHNPALTPRTSSLYQHSINDGIAPLGFEPEGKCGSPEGHTDSPLAPTYLRWARNLPWLLSDPEGASLFKSYLLQEGRQHADPLDFWFACNGLRKQTNPDQIAQLVKLIYRRFFLKTQLGIRDTLRKAVHKRVKDSAKPLDANVFDAAQSEVERLITETTYPNFLRSDIYLNHVQSMQNGSSSSESISGGTGSSSGNQATLATLHEDKELDTTNACPQTTNYPPLTKDMLIMTQKRRVVDLRPKPEAFAGVFLHGKPGSKAYSSYNPVSRQDSELQSLSSDARTESDNMSLTDTSVDGMSMGNHRMTRKQYQRHCKQVKEAASLNRDPNMYQTVIPRTQRIQKEQAHPMKPDEFASILIEKLENLKRTQEVQEKLAHKLFEGEGMESGAPAKSLAEAIRERFQIEDDNDQDILDQHVSRVWSDQTPARTPGVASPRPKSPDMVRRSRPSNQVMSKVCVSSGGATMVPHMGMSQSHHTVPHPYQARPYPRHIRKDKDVFSTFSSDSGNVHDIESLDLKLHLPKSKSMPDYAESTDTYSSLPSHDARFRQSREWCGNTRRHSKKPELTDSGVSVVSETVSHHNFQCKERVLSWLKENESACCGSHSDSCSCSTTSSRFDSKHHSKPNPLRGRRSPPPGPAQPFVADPNMPPLPSPHTPTQLEEARRRLEDQARNKQCRQSSCRCQSGKTESSLSGGSTLRRGAKSQTETHTTVVFSFCDEQFPYRSKIPGQAITLKQFKEFLPKKGNYRYFFKTECEELDMRVIQEEITDDSEILPLWEGKVMAQVKPID